MVENVREHRTRGIALVVSGEPDCVGSFHHVSATATGFGGVSVPWFPADLAAYPEIARAVYPPGWMRAARPACTGPIALRDIEAVFRDIDVFLRALAQNGVPPEQAVMTEPSPGILVDTIDDHYYHVYKNNKVENWRGPFCAQNIQNLRPVVKIKSGTYSLTLTF
jgi:5-methyltetrahydropteroyltriglutamate--homocysteine methyltransferase